MTPTAKSPALDHYLLVHFGVDRQACIQQNKCVPAPMGCGSTGLTRASFRDRNSIREYCLSGLCQHCQDQMWPNELATAQSQPKPTPTQQ